LTGFFKLLACVMLLLVPYFLILAQGDSFEPPSRESIEDRTFFSRLDDSLAEALPFQTRLRQLGLRLGLLGGQREQNDIFISDNGLIKNIDATSEVRISQNVGAILRLAERIQIPTYLMLLPTASAILQEQLPPYANIYNNQRQTIEDIYSQMSGQVTVADVYPLLYNLRGEYLYYRTENNLTPQGGYYVYTVLGAKLVGRRELVELDQLDIQYLPEPYYGDLYQKSPYQNVRPDTLSLFRYQAYPREYLVTHYGNGGIKTYHTLYPTHLAGLGQGPDVYLGGISAITTIRTTNAPPRSLLIFGDKTALAYLPFLANNYQDITLVDLFQLTPTLSNRIQPDQYHQVLFAYSLETFDSDIPLRAERLLD